MRTGKESATLVFKVISKINQMTVGVSGEEKIEVISNICIKYDINIEHILTVGEYSKTVKL